MNNKTGDDILSGIILDETTLFTITEVCQRCHVHEDGVTEMMAYGLIEPHESTTTEIRLDLPALRRIQSAMRLQEDFDINLQGVALVLELLDELEKVRSELAVLHQQIVLK